MEETILTRVYSVEDPGEVADPAYAEGLRVAVAAALSYGLRGLEEGTSEPGPIPTELFAQARYAARGGVGLDTVLRRYLAGRTLLDDFIMQEAEAGGLLGSEELQRLTRAQATLFDRLVAAVTEAYTHELRGRTSSPEQRCAECVERLLAGELVDAVELDYDLSGWHIAAIVAGPTAAQTIRDLATTLDRRLLLVDKGEGVFWAWLGGRRCLSSSDFAQQVSQNLPTKVVLAVGESSQGLSGWRLTNRQACAAWSVALRNSQPLTCYADVSLLASTLRDDVLVKFLNEIYLAPLAADRDGGTTSRETLRAYFAAERNVSSTAAAMNLTRGTISNRLRAIEERLNCSLNDHAAEIEIALRLSTLGDPGSRTVHPD